MKSYTPDMRSMNFLRAVTALLALGLIIAVRLLVPVYSLMLTLSIILAAAAVIAMFIYIPMYFFALSYTADKSEIRKKSGVLFKKNQSVKFSSVQYSTLVTTPFSEYTGLNFIVFYVYGGRIILMYLKKSDVNEILALCGSVL